MVSQLLKSDLFVFLKVMEALTHVHVAVMQETINKTGRQCCKQIRRGLTMSQILDLKNTDPKVINRHHLSNITTALFWF